jgi:hypothetical protein
MIYRTAENFRQLCTGEHRSVREPVVPVSLGAYLDLNPVYDFAGIVRGGLHITRRKIRWFREGSFSLCDGKIPLSIARRGPGNRS